MKTFLVTLLMMSYATAFAQSKDVSNDFGGSVGLMKHPLTAADLRERLEVSGEIYLLDSSGKHLLAGAHEWRRWRANNKLGTIESNWYYTSDDHKPVALHHSWRIEDDGIIKVVIEQYENMEHSKGYEKIKYKNLLKKQEITLTDFSPIVWPSVVETDKHVVVRLTPSLQKIETTVDIAEAPLSARDAIVRDNIGYVWSDHLGFSGQYVGIRTHKGSVYISFHPFKGSKEIGWALGNDISVDLGKNSSLTITGSSAFVPADSKMKIYGVIRREVKTASVSSTSVVATDKEGEFLPSLAEKEIR